MTQPHDFKKPIQRMEDIQDSLEFVESMFNKKAIKHSVLEDNGFEVKHVHFKINDWYKIADVAQFLYCNSETIRFALRLIDKLLNEQPSLAAIDRAKAEYMALEKECNDVAERVSWEGGAMVVHEAMLQQAIKEVQG